MDHVIQALERAKIIKRSAKRAQPSTSAPSDTGRNGFEQAAFAVERARLSASPAKGVPDTGAPEEQMHSREAAEPPIAPRQAQTDVGLAERHAAAVGLGTVRGILPPRKFQITDVELSPSRLEAARVVAHDLADPRAKAFDVLRTQVLQTMETNGWRVVAVTSPGPGCGKTFTALNLSISAARQMPGSVLLADLDLRKPQIAQRLEIKPKTGIRALLEHRATLEEAITVVSAAGAVFGMLPCERGSSRSSDLLASPAMGSALHTVKHDQDLRLTVLDLPPVLAGDEVMSVLPEVDCILMVTVAGSTTAVELKECARYLNGTPVVRVVFNKIPETAPAYYY
jgi:protein-tyrosine kinase